MVLVLVWVFLRYNWGGRIMIDTFRKQYNSCKKLHDYQMEIKEIAEQLEAKFKNIGQSREISLAMTNLEQSIMWAAKALYMFGDKND